MLCHKNCAEFTISKNLEHTIKQTNKLHTHTTIQKLINVSQVRRCTVWQGQSNQYCTKPLNSSPPSTLFYMNTPGELRSPSSAIN